MIKEIFALAGVDWGKRKKDVRGAEPGAPMLHYVFENKRQPDGYGASRYAFETLQLAPSSPIDRAVRVRRQISLPFQGPMVWADQAVPLNPIPSQTGGIYTGGMVTLEGGLPPGGTGSAIDMSGVARNNPNAGANDVSDMWLQNDPNGG